MVVTATNITSTGALNAGSITSGFGNIDTWFKYNYNYGSYFRWIT